MSRGKGSWTRSRGIVLGAQKSLFPLDKSALKLEIYPDSTGTLLSIKSKTIQSSSEDMGAGRRVCFALGVYLARHSADPLLCWVDHFDGTFRELSRPENVSIIILTINWHFPFRLAVEFKLRKKMKRFILLRQRFRPYCRLIPTFRVAAFLGIKANY